MAKPALRTTQKNQLFTCLQSNGFSPEDFLLTEEDDSAHIKHRSTSYSCAIAVGDFLVSADPGMGALGSKVTVPFCLVYSPGREKVLEEGYYRNWDALLKGFEQWTRYLTDELQAPDLWATVSGDTQLIRLAADQDNRLFTTEEQLQVKTALNEIRKYLIKTHDLSGDRLEAIERRLSYLEEASTRLGQKDWTGIFVSTLLSIVSTLALNVDSTRDLFRFAGQIVKQFLGTVLYLAGPH